MDRARLLAIHGAQQCRQIQPTQARRCHILDDVGEQSERLIMPQNPMFRLCHAFLVNHWVKKRRRRHSVGCSPLSGRHVTRFRVFVFMPRVGSAS